MEVNNANQHKYVYIDSVTYGINDCVKTEKLQNVLQEGSQ